MLRTHTCGELRSEHVGQETTLCGWVDTYRDHSGVLFIDLRDRYGKTQVVFNLDNDEQTLAVARGLRSEYVIQVAGVVQPRPQGTVNPKLPTGEIELRTSAVKLLNRSENPPFLPTAQETVGEDLRLKHRYLDLRRPEMQGTLVLRHRICKLMRVPTSTSTASSRSKRRCWGGAHRRGRGITSCRAACIAACSTLCRKARNCISKS